MQQEFIKPKIKYDAEADVLSWEISKRPIDNAVEIGNMIVHFSSDNLPVLVELLEAKKFFVQARQLIKQEVAV